MTDEKLEERAKAIALICPPLGGRFGYQRTNTPLSQALTAMTEERDEAESREIALHRLASAMLTQSFGGEVHVDARLLPDQLPKIRTEFDARTGLTRIWSES